MILIIIIIVILNVITAIFVCFVAIETKPYVAAVVDDVLVARWNSNEHCIT